MPQDYIIEFYQVVATAIVERIAYQKTNIKNSYIMQTLLLQAEIQEINLPIVEEFLKKIKAKKVKIKSIETLKEVVEKGRKDYKEGKTTKINPLNLWENI